MRRVRIFLETCNAMEKCRLVMGNQSQGSHCKICPNKVLEAGKSTPSIPAEPNMKYRRIKV